MEDLIADFVAESREMLESLGGEIVAWEAEPHDRARLDSIFRFVHTVKGNCGFFDFPRLEALSHAAEDALADVRAGRRQPDAALVSAVLGIIDRIGEMIEIIDRGDPLPEGDDSALINALSADAIIEAVAAPAPETEDAARATTIGSSPTAAPRTIRLSVELLDRVMSGVSDMVLARNELARRLREAPEDVAVQGAFERLSGIIAEMRDSITRTRMQRIENLFVALPRMVRDLSNELGKQVMIDIDGGDVELDREMIEMIRDPLTHIIRNAIDHGIESPAERLKAGKREIGMLAVSARQSGNQILIDIADDGKGIDAARLVDKAIASGLVDKTTAEEMSHAAKLALIFEAGLSTARAVTSVSGRGVGMDVVRSNVERIGGLVEVDSKRGEGTRMTLRVPLTLTIIPALTVSIGEQSFAIPRSAIEEIVRANGSSVTLEKVGGAGIATIRGRRVPEVALADILGLDSDMADEDRTLIVLRPAGGDVYALAVDRIHDHEELVVKPAAPAVMATGLYAGTTLADDGSPILLFDTAGLAQVGGVKLEKQERAARVAEDKAAANDDLVELLLFRGLGGQRRVVRLGAVDRIEDVPVDRFTEAGGRLRVQLGEDILPATGLDSLVELEGRESVRLFRLSDGETEIGYAFDQVIDIKALDHEVIPAEGQGAITGVSLVGEEPAEMVDAHWLFARLAADSSQQPSGLVCALPADDAWMRNMLRPIVEAAGYAVVDAASEAAAGADLVIRSAEEADSAPTGAGTLLKLRKSPEGDDDSIYRYDRAGLLMALRSVAGGTN
ncbi:chemotaxis protein CheA [Sphingomicrobium astaxanthinifaciens]|uniref:chemotaxis protein CheA n=1 Tax=Sphingomicrobium astaxanthinifaciens TaxID=1227949 RepID=UPI001FCC737A|nr:chemotaxis protein CheW [Sphingomicrobium astaxanthinifaciens]MCJ7422248.1 chemotaxis protein CheW [Sphingomicrobium astaxanthinifaciens]